MLLHQAQMKDYWQLEAKGRARLWSSFWFQREREREREREIQQKISKEKEKLEELGYGGLTSIDEREVKRERERERERERNNLFDRQTVLASKGQSVILKDFLGRSVIFQIRT